MSNRLLNMLKKAANETIEEMDAEQKVVASHVMRPEWKTIWDELHAVKKQEQALERKRQHLKSRFWNTVEHDLDDYRDMRVNRTTGSIEVVE